MTDPMTTPAGQPVEVEFSKAKALVAAVLGFLTPGAAYLIARADDGINGNDWLVAALTCIASSAITGGVVWAIPNKPKVHALP